MPPKTVTRSGTEAGAIAPFRHCDCIAEAPMHQDRLQVSSTKVIVTLAPVLVTSLTSTIPQSSPFANARRGQSLPPYENTHGNDENGEGRSNSETV